MPEKSSEVILIMVSAVFIIIVLITLILFSLFISQKRKFRHQEQMRNLQTQFDNEILKVQMEIQTDTFQTVSRELHDNVSNTIALAILRLHLYSAATGIMPATEIEQACSLLLEAKNSVRDFSLAINPDHMEDMGLANSLKALAAKLTDMKLLEVTISIKGAEFTVAAGRNIILYRIVQEALSNIIKHAAVSWASVEVVYKYPELTLQIIDEGSGFDLLQIKANAAAGHTSGLRNLEARTRMIGATFKIESAPGKGTALYIRYRASESLSENLLR